MRRVHVFALLSGIRFESHVNFSRVVAVLVNEIVEVYGFINQESPVGCAFFVFFGKYS